MEGNDQINGWWICIQGGIFIPSINDNEIPSVVIAHTAFIWDSNTNGDCGSVEYSFDMVLFVDLTMDCESASRADAFCFR